MDILTIITDVFLGIFKTVIGIIFTAWDKVMTSGLSPDWPSLISWTVFWAFLLGSPFAAASVAESRGRNRLLHFMGGLIAPWIYPVTIFFMLPRITELHEDEKAKAEEEGLDKAPENAVPDSKLKEAGTGGVDASLENVVEFNQKFFSGISADEAGNPLGPYIIEMADGRRVEIARIVSALPDVFVGETFEGDKKRTVRFPYSKIKSCRKIEMDTGKATSYESSLTQAVSDGASMLQSQETDLLNSGNIIGNCRIDRMLGCGGMGIVYLGHHTVLDLPVAVKVFSAMIFQNKGTDEYSPERFLREAKLAAKIKHPNVVSVMDAGFDKIRNLYYIIMEYVEGGTIREVINKHGPLDEQNALSIIISVAKALSIANRNGIIHRDIKPDNIMLTSDGVVKLADLGLGKEIQQADKNTTTTEGTTLGSPAYMSPEQARDFKSADIRSDIYSLGATLYHLITGELPFRGDNAINTILKVINDPVPDPRNIRPELSDGIAEMCIKMMDKEPGKRYQTPEEVIEATEALRK